MTEELAAALQVDDEAEQAGMHPDRRATCWTHQAWAVDCEPDHQHFFC